MLRRLEDEYIWLLVRDKELADSIQQKKEFIKNIEDDLEKSRKLSMAQIDSLRAENDSLKVIMREYVKQIEIEKSRPLLKALYFNLDKFIEPQTYFFENQEFPERSQYWKMTSLPDSNQLKTEVYNVNFEHFETSVERYDSIGAKFITFLVIEQSDTIYTEIDEADVFRWNMFDSYSYSLRYRVPGIYQGFKKHRQFRAINKMEVLGEELEVARFEDEYTFQFGIVTHMKQQSFYTQKYGLVRFVRFDERTRTNETYLLQSVLSEQEWLDLQKK